MVLLHVKKNNVDFNINFEKQFVSLLFQRIKTLNFPKL